MAVPSTLLFARLTGKARMRHLQLIYLIAELGHLQKAAIAINMSQPAATKALAELESVIGGEIFERHSKGMRPTPLGMALLPLVRQSLESLHEFAEVASAMAAGVSTTLRIGAVGAALSGLLYRAVPIFSRRRPDVVLDVAHLASNNVIDDCARGVLDIAICHAPQQIPQGFEFVPLASDRYVVVCSTKHPLAGVRGVTLEDLARQTWLMTPRTGIVRHAFQPFWEQMGAHTQMCWVSSRSPLIVWAMLEDRPLLRFTSYNLVRQWIEAGVLVTIPGPWESESPQLGAMLKRSDRLHNETLAAFVDELLSLSDLQDGSSSC
jgi:DNA-binding transcriptional LysR family regulator